MGKSSKLESITLGLGGKRSAPKPSGEENARAVPHSEPEEDITSAPSVPALPLAVAVADGVSVAETKDVPVVKVEATSVQIFRRNFKKPRELKTKTVNFRLKPSVYSLLLETAQKKGISSSVALERAIRAYASTPEEPALDGGKS